MAMINCPECEKKVSDKAVSCPGCGYPLQQDLGLSKISAAGPTTAELESQLEEGKDNYIEDLDDEGVDEEDDDRKRNTVVLTGPNGIQLTEGMVMDFASFIGLIFDVKLTDEKRNSLRQFMFAEWSRDDQLGLLSFGFPVALFQKLGPRWEREQEENEPGNSAIDYWRQVILHDFDKLTAKAEAAGFRPIFDTLQQIRQELGIETGCRSKDLCMDEYTFECFRNLVIDLANLLYEVKLRGGSWSSCKDIITEISKDTTDFLALGFMQYSFIQFIWPLLSEAEKPEVAEANAEDFGNWLKFGKETGFWGSEEEMKKAREERIRASLGLGHSEQLVQLPHAQQTATTNADDFGAAIKANTDYLSAIVEAQKEELAKLEARKQELMKTLEERRARLGQSGQLVQSPHPQPTATHNLDFENVMRESQRNHNNFRNLMEFMHQLNMNHLKIMGKPW